MCKIRGSLSTCAVVNRPKKLTHWPMATSINNAHLSFVFFLVTIQQFLVHLKLQQSYHMSWSLNWDHYNATRTEVVLK
jgi:hypothetical protein